MAPWVGTLLALVSSVAFGAMALFARAAYAAGVTPITLLFLRFSIAALCMFVVVLARGERLPRGRTLLGLVLMGGVGYVGQSFSFFTALTMANAGLVALLLYLYPAIVAVLATVVFKEPLNGRRAVAVAVAFIGTALTVGPQPSGRILGVLLGVAAALIYSGYILAGTYLLRSASPIAGSAVIMAAAAVVFGLLNAVGTPGFPSSGAGWLAVAGVALISTVIAVTAFLIALTVIGPTRAAVLSTVEPITTVVLAALLLREPIGVWTALGGACILGAALALSRGGGAPRAAARPLSRS